MALTKTRLIPLAEGPALEVGPNPYKPGEVYLKTTDPAGRLLNFVSLPEPDALALIEGIAEALRR